MGHFRINGPYGVPWGPEEAQYRGKVCGNHNSNPLGPIGGSWDQIWPGGALPGPPGPPKGAFWAKTGPFGAPWGPGAAQYQSIVCGNHNSNQVGPIGNSWDQIWPLRGLQVPLGPQKVPLGPKRALLVLKGAQAYDMGVSHPDTLCGSVLDASQPVPAVPGTQREPKRALDQNFHFCHREKFSMKVRPHIFLSSLLTQKCPFRAF